MKPKIIAMYLPQYHCIPENDEFWGKGFTDWVTVKNAKPLYEGHQQPRVPLYENYYDLSVVENVEWQAKIAYEHGIYGFGVYHYWFNNKKNLLTKPAEIMRDDDKIETKYFFVWDNANWRRSWSNVPGNAWAPIADGASKQGPQILIPYILGTEKDWEKHYRYLLSHFKSNRYIKVDNKPVFCIYTYSKEMMTMCEYWNMLAQKDGFKGVHIIFRRPQNFSLSDGVYCYSYEPHSSGWAKHHNIFEKVWIRFKKIKNKNPEMTLYDFDKLWSYLLKKARKHPEQTYYPGAFAGYDDSPRRGKRGALIVEGGTPEKFEKYFSELYSIASSQNKEFIFTTAWNEWGEGAYIEPDLTNGYAYLEAIKRVVS